MQERKIEDVGLAYWVRHDQKSSVYLLLVNKHDESCCKNVANWNNLAKSKSVIPEPGKPQYLADELTLLQPGRADYAHLLLLAPPYFSPSHIAVNT